MEGSEGKSQYLNHLKSFNQGEGKVVLSSDVKNDKGVLLAAKGERLNDKNIDLMIRHKLTKPLDSCIGLEPSLSAKSLKVTFDQLLDQNKNIAKILQSSGAKPAIPSCLQYMEQYPLIYQKLTIMAHVIPEHFERSMLNGSLALSLAVFSNESKQNCIKIFFISLIENIGLLHIDPKVTEINLPPVELWRTYHAHPLIAKEILKSIPSFPPSIIRGVVEHHERIDGTGFPAMAQGEEVSNLVHYTGLIDELTRLQYSRKQTQSINILELLAMLQFRRQHFPNRLFANLQSMISNAGIKTESTLHNEELKSFARLQIFYYAKCMTYCDIIARIADSITSTAATQSKSLIRLQTLSKNFIGGVFSSGMLSITIRELLEDCLHSNATDFMSDLIEIDHAHHGILDQIEEIFLFLEYTIKHESLSETDKNTEAFSSLQACHALLMHVQSMKASDSGWQTLIREMYHGRNELSTIIKTMK